MLIKAKELEPTGASASVRWVELTSAQARINKMEWENKKPFIEIKINGSDLYELNIEDLEQAKDEIQNMIDSINMEKTESEDK